MKLRVLISILFIIVTTSTAMHEIEHIGTQHDSTSCPICIVDNHTLSLGAVEKFKDIELFRFEMISSECLSYYFHKKNFTNQNRAPPFSS